MQNGLFKFTFTEEDANRPAKAQTCEEGSASAAVDLRAREFPSIHFLFSRSSPVRSNDEQTPKIRTVTESVRPETERVSSTRTKVLWGV